MKQRDRKVERFAEEDRRIAAQRAAFAAIPAGPAKQAFRITVLERAFELLDAGMDGCYASDALLEFMAEGDASALLERHFETEEEFDAAQFPAPPAYSARSEIVGLFGFAWHGGGLYRVAPRSAVSAPAYRRIDWKVRARRARSKTSQTYAKSRS